MLNSDCELPTLRDVFTLGRGNAWGKEWYHGAGYANHLGQMGLAILPLQGVVLQQNTFDIQ